VARQARRLGRPQELHRPVKAVTAAKRAGDALGQARVCNTPMRIALASMLCLAVLTACGGSSSGRVITLRQAVSAVHSAGYAKVRVDDASRAVAKALAGGQIAQLKKIGVDVAGLRQDTPDYIYPRRAPYLMVVRFPSARLAQRVLRAPQVTRVCNVVVFNWIPQLHVARDGAARISAELRRRCR
jgi:hypothetical protein